MAPASPTAAPGLGAVRRRLAGLVPAERITRRLAVQTLVNTFGNGLFFTASAVFFTRSVGLPAGQVGLGMTIAGCCGVAVGVPLGHLADRVGPRRLLVILALVEAVGMLSYTQVRSFPAFLVAACVVTSLDRGGNAVRAGLMVVVLPPDGRVRARAYLRAVTNVGMGAGAALAGVALQVNTREAYLALIVADAATFVGSAALLATLPAGRTAAPDGSDASAARVPWWRPMTDVRYLVVTGLNAVLALQFGLMEVGAALWVVRDTTAPALMVSVIMLINTVMVVLLQVRAARGTEEPGRAARAARTAGFLLGVSCLVFGLSSGIPAIAAMALLVLGAVLQTLGEVLSSAAGWALSYDLADPAAPSAYQGVYNSGFAAAIMLAPVLSTSTVIRYGLPGWLLLGALFVVAGVALVPVTRWAVRRRPATG